MDFFIEEGFHHKKCEKCGKFFWTRDGSRKTCGDPPCDPYTFIGSPIFKRQHSLDEMREHYLGFFEARGHTRIKRYPVAARWRDDIYLTIASIADFQPFVTSGQVPPPANPLTISQPCIRLDDLDSVGRSGRHLTTFEMMAHHVFNTPDREIYWKDRTVRLCDELLVGLGMDPLAVTYKENPWAGGGNAGPSVEVMVGGLELATLVFMDLKVVSRIGLIKIKDEFYDKMDNYIVDTGYGLERFVWASNGAPTIYDAIFPDLVRQVADLAGVEHNLDDPEYAEIFAQNARLAGMVDLDEYSMSDLRAKIAGSIGIDPERLEKAILPMERVYAVVDHTRCLAYMLGDGIIPSNVKGGYLSRLVIRRTLRLMKELGLRLPLADLVQLQISRLDYPDWEESFATIREILDQEEQKYAETLEKGMRLVRKTAESYLKKKEPVPLSEMIALYDTHGIPPEIAREAAVQMGAQVELPDNFYSLVAKKHIRAEPVEEKKPPIPGKTELLFYENPFEQEFEAEVLDVVEGSAILDRTLLYPEGGGQPADHGTLEKDGQLFQVTDVQKSGDVVLHKLAEPCCLAKGDRVKGKVDMLRRLAHARHHTATHLVHDSAKRVLGKHIWQAGAQKSEDRARLDISHFKRITDAELKAIELEANRRVMELVPVDTQFLPRTEAEKLFGFELYQGGVPPGKLIRVVRVGSDIEACAGTHVTNTGMIGMIKILRAERVQDGVERVEFAAGEAAVRASQARDDLLAGAAGILRVPNEQLPRTAERFFEEWKEQQKEIERLKEDLAIARLKTLVSEAETIDGLRVIVQKMGNADIDELLKAAALLAEEDCVALLGSKTGKLVAAVGQSGLSKGVKAGSIIKAAAKVLGGGGGGRPQLAQGGGPDTERLEEALAAGKEAIRAGA